MDQNNLIVYLEIEDGKVADVSLELLTKGRELASTPDGCNLHRQRLGSACELMPAQRSDRRLYGT